MWFSLMIGWGNWHNMISTKCICNIENSTIYFQVPDLLLVLMIIWLNLLKTFRFYKSIIGFIFKICQIVLFWWIFSQIILIAWFRYIYQWKSYNYVGNYYKLHWKFHKTFSFSQIFKNYHDLELWNHTKFYEILKFC